MSQRVSAGFEQCPVCEGSTFDPSVLSQLPVECPRCKGTGRLSVDTFAPVSVFGIKLREALSRRRS